MNKIYGVAIDTETTGLIAGTHEIIELSLIIHDEFFLPLHTFSCKVRPMRPELADPKALEKNKLSLTELKKEAVPSQVRNALCQWHEEVLEGIKLIPLGHNYSFDKSFLQLFLGMQYNNIFNRYYRDTVILAQALKDKGKLDIENLSLHNLSKFFKCSEQIHRAEFDARLCLQIYKKLLDLI